MKLRHLSGLVPACLMTVGIAACGGSNGVDVSQVKQDFDHPSGSATDQQGIAAAAGAQENMSSGPASGFTGGAVPGFSSSSASSNGLTAETLIHKNFAPFVPHNIFMPQISEFANQLVGKKTFGLMGTASFSSCIDTNQIKSSIQSQEASAQADFAKNGKATISYSLTVDLGSCANSGYTGKFDMSVKATLERTTTSVNVTANADIAMNNVCESVSGACVNGGLSEEAIIGGSTDVSNMTGTGGTSGSGNVSFTLAWNLTASGKDKSGAAVSVTAKGGERLAAQASNGMGSAQIELLFYVKNSKGAEVSYVLKVTADSTGKATLELKCSDGNLSCTREADGSGMCTGTVNGQPYNQSWDAGLYESAKLGKTLAKM